MGVEGPEQSKEFKWRQPQDHFVQETGKLAPTFDAGFSADWAASTRKAALAAGSRLAVADAYRYDAGQSQPGGPRGFS